MPDKLRQFLESLSEDEVEELRCWMDVASVYDGIYNVLDSRFPQPIPKGSQKQ